MVTCIVFGSTVLFMNLFSHVAISILKPNDGEIMEEQNPKQRMKTIIIMVLGLVISPFIVKKRLQELNFMTYVMFTGVICLVTLLSIRLNMEGSYESRNGPAIDSNNIEGPNKLETVIDCINIGVASQGFVISLFPIYCDMTSDARPNVLFSVLSALTFTFTIYVILGLVSIQYYGLSNVEQNIFEIIQTSHDVFTLILRLIFGMIFFCAIPLIFFAGKLSIMSIVQKCSGGHSVDDVSKPLYFAICFVFLIIICIASIIINDLTLIFGLMSGLSEVFVLFIWPALFYLLACRMEASGQLVHQDPLNQPLIQRQS